MRRAGDLGGHTQGARSVTNSYTVTRFSLFESGRWHDRHLRPLALNSVTQQVVDAMADTVGVDGKINPRAIADMSNSVLTLQSQIDPLKDRIDIANGWNEKRLSFMLELRVESDFSAASYLYVTGYTDRMDVAYQSNTIADDTEFFINSMFEMGSGETIRIPRNYQIINAHAIADGGYDSDRVFMSRPLDVLNRLSLDNSPRYSSYRDDTSNVGFNTLNTSNRQNTISSQYLANTLNALTQAARYEDAGNAFYQDDEQTEFFGRNRQQRGDMYADAAGIVKEQSITSDVFLYDLKTQFDYHRHGSFTFGQLRQLVPDIDRVGEVWLLRQNPTRTDRRVGDMDGKEWGGSTDEAIAAAIIAQAFPTIGFYNLITSIDVTFTNEQSRDGTIEYKPGEAVVFFTDRLSARQERDLIMAFGETCISDVLNGLTEGGHIDIYLNVSMNVQGDIFINIALNGGDVQEFNTATFCDSLTTPLITTNDRLIDKLAKGLRYIHDSIRRD